MPQVGGKQRQFRVHIDTCAVPAKQRIDSKGMPKIVDLSIPTENSPKYQSKNPPPFGDEGLQFQPMG
jgi:hypothetical protein